MIGTHTFKLSVRGVLCALAVAALLTAVGGVTSAQHQGHDMRNMPGMDMSKPKAKPKAKRKVGAKTKTAARRKKRTRPAPKKRDMRGMNMNGMPMPSHSPTPTPSSGKSDMENMPGMQMPMGAPSTTPQGSPTPEQKMDMSMPMNHPMPQAGPSPAASPGTAGGMGDMPGMTHGGHTQTATPNAGGMGSMSMGPLLVMSENDMGIRVGSSQNNLMSMGAMGSGTAWQPSSAPMHMYYKVAGDWLVMFHFNLTAGVNRQGGPRGVTKFESQNWFMPMAYRKVGRGTLQLRSMFSAEPFTFPPGGSPLLFQTGETYKGQPLIDKQHPHDLFMELSAQYTLPVGERGTWFTYFGYPGEPALGPVAFMHRMSASENPSATLSHHLQDSTHIAFGVLTTGFTYRWLKLEGSLFNGREPDENRYDFDSHKWNSRSARLQFAPNRNWVAQVSYGFLRSPEGQEPDADVRRVTASVQYNKAFDRGNWASSLVWGRNHVSEHGETRNLNGYTFESTVNFLDKNYLYTRLELVDKDELLRASDRTLLGITNDHPSFRVGAYTFGGARDLWNTNKLSFAVGSDLTFYSKPAALDPVYGNNPVSWKLFFRIRPGKMDMSMRGTHGGGSTTPSGQPEQ
ncbi:MAG: hypothetical protein QOE46_175 [Acidobacteriota bacterium]|jgi:hypothetical protein|nr:hypothetical protein [Acidobacteriota bacterium]